MAIRKAKLSDIKDIHTMINESAKREEMLPRSLNDLYEHIRDFFVYDDGRIKGICALHVCWEDIAEIRSLIVRKDARKAGIGSRLVKTALKEAKSMGIKKIFALTYMPLFFGKFDFYEVDKTKLPHKIWGDCMRCPKFPECDEVAVIKEI